MRRQPCQAGIATGGACPTDATAQRPGTGPLNNGEMDRKSRDAWTAELIAATITDMDADSRTFTAAGVEPLLTTGEAADALRLKPNTLAAWRCSQPQRLPFVKLGHRVRYRQRDVAQLIDAGKAG